MPLPVAVRIYFRQRRHTLLLIVIVAAFAVRPFFGDSRTTAILFSLAILVLLLITLFTIQIDDLIGERDMLLVQRRRRHLVAWALAVLAATERLAGLFVRDQWFLVVGSIGWLVFFCFVTWSQLRCLLKQREVTSETISMAIAVYLLLGLSWGLLYAVIFERHPDAFSFGASPRPESEHIFPVLVYFSLTTLSTIGFGDITPLAMQARYAAVAEGITGQFYLAILVARLVGMQMSRRAEHRE